MLKVVYFHLPPSGTFCPPTDKNLLMDLAPEGELECMLSDRIVAAICAGPLVLQAAGVLTGKRATCHPAVVDELTCTRRLDDRVVRDGAIVTSQAPGTAMEFALALIDAVDGWQAAEKVAAGLVLAR